jgi:hydrogenase nickel incorporation protein HypA/HybF
MHEIEVLTKAVDLVESVAKDNGLDHIASITLEVGELTGYVPVFFEQYFPVVTEDRPLFQGTELRIRTVRGQALCRECQSLYNVMRNEGRCPKCGSREKKILGGQQFLVKEIEYQSL